MTVPEAELDKAAPDDELVGGQILSAFSSVILADGVRSRKYVCDVSLLCGLW
jgi:hypothetical protein